MFYIKKYNRIFNQKSFFRIHFSSLHITGNIAHKKKRLSSGFIIDHIYIRITFAFVSKTGHR